FLRVGGNNSRSLPPAIAKLIARKRIRTTIFLARPGPCRSSSQRRAGLIPIPSAAQGRPARLPHAWRQGHVLRTLAQGAGTAGPALPLPLPPAAGTGRPPRRVPPSSPRRGPSTRLPCAPGPARGGRGPPRAPVAPGGGGRAEAGGRPRRTPARRPPRRGASRAREHVPGAWRGGPGGGRRGRGRGGGEVEPGCGRGDRRFPPPSAPHLAGPPLARGPVPRGAQASPAGPPRRRRRRSSRRHRRRAARPAASRLRPQPPPPPPPPWPPLSPAALWEADLTRCCRRPAGSGTRRHGGRDRRYSQYQRMLSTLSQCEFSMGKTLLVYDMNLREMENYEKIYKDIENSIAAAHEKISECKKQILQAKRIRKNRQEYDALAKVIQHHPDRHETLKQLEALGKELQHLSHIKENVEDKLELRRKQFHVLLSTIHELQQTLENDEKLSEAEESQETQMETETKQ
uniref:THO complex 7 n=4 Tax=Neoaves TaxID=3078114 RepID=A0A8B9RWA1_9AVES